jgi:PAS domain S-box-containing protein
MLNIFWSWSIRKHLIILLALFAFPSMWMVVHRGIDGRNEAIEGAKKDCLRLVNTIATDQQAVTAGAQQLLTALAFLPEVRSRNREAVSALFSNLVKKNPQYASISVTDQSGFVWASAIPFEGKVSLADRRYFQEAVRTGAFSSGEYLVGRMLKRPVISFGYPVKDGENKPMGVIVVVLDLQYAQQVFERVDLPAGASFSLLDHRGVILIRNLKDESSERLVGKTDIRQELFTEMEKSPDEGTFESMGNDDKPRLVVYKKLSLPDEAKPYLYIRSSVPLASATAKANTLMMKNAGYLVLLFGVGLFLVWFMGKRVIVNPIMLLKQASEHLKDNAEGMNVSQLVKGGELGDLARVFDDMAETLIQRENALRESQHRWATTLASIGDAVIATDGSGRITFMNPVAEVLTGWTLRDASLKPVGSVFKIVNEYTREAVESPVARVLREGMIVGLANHTILVQKDGKEIPIDDSGAPIKNGDGRTMGVVLVFRDITRRKADEERIIHLASFPEINPNPVLEIGFSGAVAFSNPAAERALKDLGMDKDDCNPFVPADMDAILSDWDKMYELSLSREVTLKDRIFGETIHLVPQFNVARIYARDITERKRAEEALRSAHNELELRVRERTEELRVAYESLQREMEERKQVEEALRQAHKMEALGTLAGGIAHDFNNSLASILGFTEMAMEDVSDRPLVEKNLRNVLKSAMRARDLVKQILTFSRKASYERSPISLSPLVKESVQLLRASIPALIDIRLSLSATSDTVLAAPVEVQQIIMNLATNASLAMEETGGTLEIGLTDIDYEPDSPAVGIDGAPGQYVQLVVKDTGVGMNPDVMKRIFEPFFTTREVGKGTGMGLAVVYGIVKDMQGTITVESVPGMGSTFRVLLPKVKTEAKEEKQQAACVPGGKERILFIDDEQMLVEWGQATLERLGYSVTAMTDGVEALRTFSADPSAFDLVITDHAMPRMRGSQLASELLRLRPDMPIILCTGHSETMSPERAQEIGIRVFLMKPLSRQELAEAVRKALDDQSAEGEKVRK